ncbi:MAG: cell division FtsA domain-containing protein [Odoribacter sp.]
MGFTASLDMGSEKMVMALASTENNACRLTGIKIVASQGIERGIVKDKEKVRACIRGLMSELLKERDVDVMIVALSGDVLRISERRITVPLQKKVVEQNDLLRAEQRCIDGFEEGHDELVDVIPVAYSIDKGDLIADPLGRSGRHLEVTYQVYAAGCDYLEGIRKLFDGTGIGEVCFSPAVRAYSEAFDVEKVKKDFALVDFGAMKINVVLFRDGMLEYEACLPLGAHSIDNDIMKAFALSGGQARKLKHEYGQALRSACKNKKLQIPDTRLTLESRDLAMVIQSRAEELLEGVVYQLQSWGFDEPEDEILLTGGGSRLQDIDTLLNRLSGHRVGRVIAKGIHTTREEVLHTPEYLVALGLLLSDRQVPQETKGSLGGKITKGLKGIFGI